LCPPAWSQRPASSLVVTALALASLLWSALPTACADTCTQGDTRCSGNKQQICLDGTNWYDRTDCTPTGRWPDLNCVTFDEHNASCSFAADKLPACAGSPLSVCFDNAVLGCYDGYATVTYVGNGPVYQDCDGGTCAVDGGIASCLLPLNDAGDGG
jgi:hypothetical protein